MKAYGTAQEDGGQGILTEKQCQVLDLLIENKTSKEIARTLGISPYTVDQRISLARGKLGVSSRTELAARYRLMRKKPDPSPCAVPADLEEKQSEALSAGHEYGSPGADQSDGHTPDPAEQQEDNPTAHAASSRGKLYCPTDSKIDHRVGPEVFEGRSGGLWRLGAIVATALLLVMTVLGVLAIFDQLNDMLT